MPISMGGMASGMDTEGIIEKLVQVESRPIQQWTVEKETYKRRKDSLGELKTRLVSLSDSVKDLYGYRASYDDKKAVSSNQAVLEATANKIAEKGTREIKVKELASTHKIATDKIGKDEILPECKFRIEVNGESQSVKFKGGTLESLRNRISEAASELVSPTYVKTDENNYILTIESKITGKRGEILLSGDKDVLKKIGLVKGEVGEKQDKVSLVFDRKYFAPYDGAKEIQDGGTMEVAQDGISVKMSGLLWREYTLPASAPVQKDTILEFVLDYQQAVTEQEEEIPFKIEMGPDEEITIKGIKLNGYNVPRIRQIEKKEEKKTLNDVTGIGVVAFDNGKRIEKIYPRGKDVKGKQVLPVGADFEGKSISKIIFYCNEGSAKFSNAGIMTPIKGTGLLEAKNVIKNASDAKIEMDGVEIVRNKNNDLDDVVKGLNINLKRASSETVRLAIESDMEKSIDKIKKFVKSYNEYLDYHIKLTKTAEISRPNNFARSQDEIGLLVGDMTVIRLENFLKTAIGEAYPSRVKEPIKILVQTGISTGAVNSDWSAIKEGKLVVEENTLRKTIENNSEGISEFFGSDTDGDNRIDNGMAYRVETILKPYITSGNSIMTARINQENELIKNTEDRIERQKEHVKKYEENLRTKFSSMERSVSDSKSQGKWMKSNLGDNSGE